MFDKFEKWIWKVKAREAHVCVKALCSFFRIVHIAYLEFKHDAITLRARALTFTVVLSMVPVLALGTAVLKGLGAGDQMRQAAYVFIEQLGGGEKMPVPEKKEEVVTLSQHMRRAVDTVFDYVDRTNFATLGVVGIVGLLITVIGVLGDIEQAMNTIWKAESSRPLGRKVMDYLALMILLPVAINVGIAAMTALHSKKLSAWIHALFPFSWAAPMLINLFTIAVLVATFIILYRFLPNTNVPFKPACIGGFVGGVGWLLVQALYVKIQLGVARYNAIYGSFATIPLVLLWLYVGWLVFLAGAEVAYAIHVSKKYLPGRLFDLPSLQLSMAYDVLFEVCKDFKNRVLTTVSSLQERLAYPGSHVAAMVEKLIDAGFLLEVENDKEGIVPAGTPEKIGIAEVWDTIIGNDVADTAGGKTAAQALKGARDAIDGASLAQNMDHL